MYIYIYIYSFKLSHQGFQLLLLLIDLNHFFYHTHDFSGIFQGTVSPVFISETES